MEAELTDQDPVQLIEAVSTWEAEEGRDHLMSLMLAGVMAPDQHAAKRAIEEREEKFKTLHPGRLRMEQATLLKAKLILMRQRMAASRIGA